MNKTKVTDNDLFAGGPPLKLQARLGMARPGAPDLVRSIVFVILIGWVPLAVLTAVQSLVQQRAGLHPFLFDLAVHLRSFVAAPLLIFADSFLVVRLGAIARHFLDGGLVPETDHGRFDDAVATTRRLRDSTLAEVAVVVIAYAIVGALIYTAPGGQLPEWNRAGSGDLAPFSLAGWWHALVSIPLLLVLILGWLWRLFLWARFLWLMSRLDLQLVAAHPDRAAGLKFVGFSARAFLLHGMTLGIILAGRVANRVVNEGESLFAFKYAIAGLVILVVALVAVPLLLFGGKMLSDWRRGVFEYGTLARGVGRQFERKWFDRARPAGDEALEVQDFSSMTDLYQIVANVYGLQFFPLDYKSLVVLVAATLLPFLPVLFISLPLDQITSWLAQLLL